MTTDTEREEIIRAHTIETAKRLGYDLFWSMGSAYYSKGPTRDARKWSRPFETLAEAADAAIAAENDAIAAEINAIRKG